MLRGEGGVKRVLVQGGRNSGGGRKTIDEKENFKDIPTKSRRDGKLLSDHQRQH